MIPSLDTYRAIAADNLWITILPEIAIAVLALAVLVLELLLPPGRRYWIPRIAMGGQGLVLAGVGVAFCLAADPLAGRTAFNGMLQFTPLGDAARVFFLVCGILVCFLGSLFLRRRDLPRVEFFHLILVATGAFMLLAQSSHFLMLFLALETVAVALYILVGYQRQSAASLEGGLKLLIPSALSSAILLAGIVLVYGAAGNPLLVETAADAMRFGDVAAFARANPDNPLLLLGMMLVLAGVAFKIGLVPFQIWIPDVYQGAPTPVTALLAVASKGAGVIVLINLLQGPFETFHAALVPALAVVAMVTILFGNLAALGQRKVKRLMGLSGISHAGFLLLGVAAIPAVPWVLGAVVFYLFVYLLGAFAVFAVMIHVGGLNDPDQRIEDYEELGKASPFLAGVLCIGLGSLAGIPPLAGFIAKLLLFIAAFQAELYLLLGIAVVGVVISIYYYFGWIRAAVFREPPAPQAFAPPAAAETVTHPVSVSMRLALVLLAAMTVLLGLYPAVLHWVL